MDLHSQLKNGPPDEVAALVNRIRAEDYPESRPPLEQGSITADGQADEAESSEDVTSDGNWESLHTTPSGYGEMQQQQALPQNLFFAGVGDQIPIDPALSGLDPQLQQYGNPNPSAFPQQNMLNTSYDQDPTLNMYGLPLPASGSPPSARSLFISFAPSMLRSNIAMVRQGLALQMRATPESCSAYSESQVEGLISSVEMRADHEIPRSHLCELSSVAAVAAQYVRAHLHPGIVEFFYGEYIRCGWANECECTGQFRCRKALFRRLHAVSLTSSGTLESVRYARTLKHP